MFKRLLILTITCCLSSPLWAMSLEQAISITIASDPELKSAFNDLMSKNEDIVIAQGDYLPDLNASAGAGYENNNISNSPIQDSGNEVFTRKEASISLTQLIWDGSTIDNIDRTEFEAEAQRFQLLSDAQNKSLRVIEAYVEVLQSDQLMRLSQDNVNIHKKILHDIERRANSGVGSIADLSQVKARMARATSNMLAAQSNLADARTSFFRLVGAEIINPITPEVDALYLPSSLEETLEFAFKLNPVLKLATLDIKAAHAQYRQNKGRFYPKFTFEADQSWSNDERGIEEDIDQFSAMLRVSFNLYNGGADNANVRRSAYQLNKSKDILDNSSRLLKESTHLSWSAYQLTEQQKQYLANHVDAASETVIAYEKQFRIGRRSLLDLLNTENELFEARRSYLDTHYSNIIAKYRVLNSMGTLLDALRVDVPKQWLTPIIEKES